MSRQNALRPCLRLISRFIHRKTASDSACHPRTARKTLKHQGVSFEILNPKITRTPSLPTQLERTRLENVHPSSLPTELVSEMQSSGRDGTSSPLPCIGEGVARKPTPRIYDNLSSAHSSITARISSNNTRSIQFPQPEEVNPAFFKEVEGPARGITDGVIKRKYENVDDFPYSHSNSTVPKTPTRNNSLSGTPSRNFSGQSFASVARNATPGKTHKRLRNVTPKIPRGLKRHQRNRQPGICYQVRPLFSDILSRRLTSLHVVRGRNRVAKTRAVSVRRRARRNVVRNIQVIDGFIYTPTTSGFDAHDVTMGLPHSSESGESYNLEQEHSRNQEATNFHFLEVNHQTFSDGGGQELDEPQLETQSLQPLATDPTSDEDEGSHEFLGAHPIQATHQSSISSLGNPDPIERASELTSGSGSVVDRVANHIPFESVFQTSSSLGNDVRDLGPGSSQTTSTTRMSQNTMSSFLRSQIPLETVSESADPFEINPSLTNSVRFFQDIHRENTFQTVSDANDDDWETVLGSTNNGLAQAATGSSLADFSTFGSLANTEMFSPGPVRTLSSSNRFLRGEPPSQNLPASELRHAYLASASSGGSSGFGSPNSKNPFSPVPALSASTKRRAAPMTQRSPQYRHPAPLDGHYNPFKLTPPNLDKRLTTLPEKNESRVAPLSPLGNSESLFNSDTCRPESGLQEALEEAERHFRASSPYPARQRGPSGNVGHHSPQIKEPLQLSSAQTSHGNKAIPHPSGFPAQETAEQGPSAISVSDADQNSDESPVTATFELVTTESRHPSLLHKRDPIPKSPSRERLIQEPAAARRFPPGSLYLSIRSARGPLASGDRLSEANSPRDGVHTRTPPRTLQQQADEMFGLCSPQRPRYRNTLTSLTQQTTSPFRSSIFSVSSLRRESNGRDSAVRGRLSQLEPALLSEFRESEPNHRPGRLRPQPVDIQLANLPLPSLPAIRESIASNASDRRNQLFSPSRAGSTLYSGGSWDETTTLVRSPQPPLVALFPGPPTDSEQTHRGHIATPESEGPAFNPDHCRNRTTRFINVWATPAEDRRRQRRMGRQLLFMCAIGFPVGWFMLWNIGYKGLGNSLIERWSKKTVSEFHDRERRMARVLLLALCLLGVAACTTGTVLMIKYLPRE